MDQAAVEYRRFLDGDDAGLEALIRAYKDGLMLFLNSYVQDLAVAEELMEETFVRLVVRRPHFSPHASFKTYLYTIGRRLAVDYLRRTARVTTLPPEDWSVLQAEQETLEQHCLREERRIRLHRAMGRLNPAYRQVLYLAFFEELSNPQIATVTGQSRRQVENRLYRAKAALRAELVKEGIQDEGL